MPLPYLSWKKSFAESFWRMGFFKAWVTCLLAWPCNKPFSAPNSDILVVFGLIVCWAHVFKQNQNQSPETFVAASNNLFLDGFIFSFLPVQSLSHVWLFATPWTAAYQSSLSITNSRSPPKLMSIESVMPSNHLILCPPLLLLPSIFPSIRVFSNESALHIRWPKYWSFSFNISPSNEPSVLISFRMDWLDLLGVQGTLKILELFKVLNTTVQKYQFFGAQLSL